MGTIQLPWPVSKLDEASLNIAATLEAVGEAVDAVPTENAFPNGHVRRTERVSPEGIVL